MRRLTAAFAPGVLVALGALGACASPGYPPGGPEDLAPPVLVTIVPESAATSVRPDRVLFRFDEVIDERSGGNDLRTLILISPVDGEVDVDWRRQTLAVRPRRGGWRPNTVYTVTLLPGLRDLRGNVLNEGATAIFSTGPIIPDTELTGVAFDWPAGREMPLALVQAISRPDSTVYITRADSGGQFRFRHLPAGLYTVFAFADQNRNRSVDLREAWDTTQVSLTDTGSVRLYAFVHDTIGPGISDIRVADSVTVRLGVDRPLDVEQPITAQLFTIVGPDSVSVPIAEALSARDFEARERAGADTGARAQPAPAPPPRDTLAPARPTLDRPIPVTDIVLRLSRPLAPETQYRIRAEGLRSLAGYTGTSERTFTTPRPAPPRVRPDTAPPPPPASSFRATQPSSRATREPAPIVAPAPSPVERPDR